MDYREILKVLNEDDSDYTPEKSIANLERLKKSFEDIYKQLNPNKRKNKKSPHRAKIEETAAKFKEMIEGIEKTIEREREMAGIKKKKTLREKIKSIFKPVNEEIYRATDKENLTRKLKMTEMAYEQACKNKNNVLKAKLKLKKEDLLKEIKSAESNVNS